jgi:hypothetical protein
MFTTRMKLDPSALSLGLKLDRLAIIRTAFIDATREHDT